MVKKSLLMHIGQRRVYSILVDGKSYEVDISQDNDDFLIEVEGETHRVSVIDERKKYLRNIGSSQKESGSRIISAPMPGRVVRILKKPGEKVKKNHGVIVVEAMKMENELKVNRDGLIKNIFVKEGDTVEAGQKLLEVG